MVYVKVKNIDPDIEKLTRRSKQFVVLGTLTWIMTVLSCRYVLALVMFRTANVDKVLSSEGALKIVYVLLLQAIGNFTDVASIVLYLAMKWSLNRKISPVGEKSDDEADNNSTYYNGIYMGPKTMEQAGQDTDRNSVQVPVAECNEIVLVPNSLPGLNTTSPKPLTQNEEVAVAMALEIHVLSALIDVLVPLMGLFPLRHRAVLVMLFENFANAWWPIILTVRTHSMLRSKMKEELSEVWNGILK